MSLDAADRELERRARLACDLLRVPGGPVPIVVACSGGADSAAALLLVRAARPQARLTACYVDHRVRPRAAIAADRRAVRDQARAARARVVCKQLTARSDGRGSSEAALRSARYRALAQVARAAGATLVVTGHHRDDIAETTLLALVRGSGLDGIAAIRPHRRLAPGVALVRPLLWASKAVLAHYAGAAGVKVAVDETNDLPRYRRNLLRLFLRQIDDALPGAAKAIARSAVIAAEDASLLRGLAAATIRRTLVEGSTVALRSSSLRSLPVPLLRHVLRLFVRRHGVARDFSYAQCVAVADAVRRGGGGTFSAGSARLVLSAGRITIGAGEDRAPLIAPPVEITAPRRSTRVRWGRDVITMTRTQAPGERERPSAMRGSASETAARAVRLDGRLMRPGRRLLVRAPSQGDRFRPAGRRTDVALARFLAKQGLTTDERALVPLICADGRIAAVAGVRAAADFAARPGGPALEVRYSPANAPRPRRRADA